ncbi:hypothetical protein [Streptomyces angustmyceticus]|uniref:hypothetical protein n=1 Tax=Streptomyces angustmyceticus TaxID=285578 RepID=UPI00344C4E5A
MSDCTACQAPIGARFTFTTCQSCEDWMRDRLNEIEHLWLELPDFLERGTTGAGPRVSGGNVEAPLPLNGDVLDLAVSVYLRLGPHEAAIRAARHEPAQAPRPVAADESGTDLMVSRVLRSLRRNLPWAAEHVDLAELALTLRELAGEMRHATGNRPDTKTLNTPCPACSGTLLLHHTTRSVHCSECGRPVDPAAFTARAA